MARASKTDQARGNAAASYSRGSARRITSAHVPANCPRVEVKSHWSPELQCDLESMAPISPQELDAIRILLGDDLDMLFSD